MLHPYRCCCQWIWLFKRVMPLELQIGAFAGSRAAVSIVRSLIVCTEVFEDEDVAVFHWSDEKVNSEDMNNYDQDSYSDFHGW